MTSSVALQEVNPSLKDAEAVQQTVAVGCSLARSALGKLCLPLLLATVPDFSPGETLL